MMEQISKYFQAEKNESVLFVLVGLVALFFSIYFFVKLKEPFYNGMAVSLTAIALIQLTVGTTVYLRSPKDIERVNLIVQSDVAKIKTEEIPRMEVVLKNFVIYRWVEIVLLLLGVFIFFYFNPNTFIKGLGFGLFVQALFMLALDYFAESRGKSYFDFLKSLL